MSPTLPKPLDPAEFEPNPQRKATDSGFVVEEPTFTLRAQDILAPAVVKAWCEMAAVIGVNPEKIREARQIALSMEQWQFGKKRPD